MPPSHQEERPKAADEWIWWLLLATLVATPLPWGGNSEIMMAAYSTIFFLLLLIWIPLYAFDRIKLRTQWITATWLSLMAWGLWLCWLAIQIIPFPLEMVSIWSPLSAEMHTAAAPLIGRQENVPISIDRGASISQFILSLGYFCLYILVLVTVRDSRRIRLLLWALLLSGLFQALYGMHMTLSGMEYGFLEKKKFNIGVATGTFVNRNHYAAYLELALAAGIGLVVTELGESRARSWRATISNLIDVIFSAKMRARVMLVVIVAALILTRSRMGSVAFFVALAACGVLFTLLRYRRWFIPSILLFSSLIIIDLLVVSQWFGLDKVVERLEQTDLENEGRALVLEDLFPVIRAYELTGAGLGNFAAAYSPFTDENIEGYFDHAHNEYVEFMIETGLIGCSILGGLLLIHVLHCVRILARRKTLLYAGGALASLMAITAMMIHAAAEFMLRIPAVAATFVALMALGMSISSQSRTSRNSKAPAQPSTEDPL